MTDERAGGRGSLAAGGFSDWADRMQKALRDEAESDVPCAGCTACCRSRQFVPVAPDETDTLAHIPPELLFPAPRLPAGHHVLGYDERGHCPMLGEEGCTVYEHRPRACRTYDCRVFAASGVEPGDGQEAVGRQVARWRFTIRSPDDTARFQACRAAAEFLDAHLGVLPGAPSPSRRAAGAVAVHELFVARRSGPDGNGTVPPDPARVRHALQRRLPADRGSPSEGGETAG